VHRPPDAHIIDAAAAFFHEPPSSFFTPECLIIRCDMRRCVTSSRSAEALLVIVHAIDTPV
jgi:hypothetical protein